MEASKNLSPTIRPSSHGLGLHGLPSDGAEKHRLTCRHPPLPQVPGAVNCVPTVTTSAVYIGMLMVTDPSIHPSEGAFTPVTVKAPPGSVVNPHPPAATVSGLTETCNRIIDMVFGALAPGIQAASRPEGSARATSTPSRGCARPAAPAMGPEVSPGWRS